MQYVEKGSRLSNKNTFLITRGTIKMVGPNLLSKGK